MNTYRLYYWDVPFRGIFPQLLLEEIGLDYEWHDASEIYPKKSLKLHDPGMAPPYLYEAKSDNYLAQMPAILIHLAREHGYMPSKTETFDLAVKTIMDCHDILLEFTNSYGKQMWTKKDWEEFRGDRLSMWMEIFELTGKAHGLKEDRGFLLGPKITVADIATTALFGTMIFSFPELEDDLKKNAPLIYELVQRIEARPRIREFLDVQRTEKGEVYCGGEIEKSIRKMVA
ncbi:MAG: glutathione S-transferase family protein [Bdellovibrionota bacterium]